MTAIALAAGIACSGCGAADRAPAATATARAFQEALSRHDGRAACAQLSSETASKLAHQEGTPCAAAILDQDLPTATAVARAQVHITSAAAEVGGRDWIFLDEAADGWEISAAGCRPAARPELPLDCELEG